MIKFFNNNNFPLSFLKKRLCLTFIQYKYNIYDINNFSPVKFYQTFNEILRQLYYN